MVRGRLTPEVGALLMRAMEAVRDALAAGSGGGRARTLARPRPMRTPSPAPVARADPRCPRRRLACDASVVRVRHGRDGSILDVGRRTRTISPALRRTLEVRDRGCRFPGCGLRFTDAHHVTHWADGGETSLEGCLLLCHHHHWLAHEGGWRIEWRGAPTTGVPLSARWDAHRREVAAARASRAIGGVAASAQSRPGSPSGRLDSRRLEGLGRMAPNWLDDGLARRTEGCLGEFSPRGWCIRRAAGSSPRGATIVLWR